MLVRAILFLIFDNMTLACCVRMVDRSLPSRLRNGGKPTSLFSRFALTPFATRLWWVTS